MLHYDPNFHMTAAQIVANLFFAALLLGAVPIIVQTNPSISRLTEMAVLPRAYNEMNIVKKVLWGGLYVLVGLIFQMFTVVLVYIAAFAFISLMFNRYTIQGRAVEHWMQRQF